MRIHLAITLMAFGCLAPADRVFAQSESDGVVAPPALGATSIRESPAAGIKYLAPTSVPTLPGPPRRYSAPAGFAGHSWGEPRASFARLPEKPAAVSAAWSIGMMGYVGEINCTGKGLEQCSVEDYARHARRQRFDGGGFHVLSEYLIESQGFRLSDTGVLLHPVVYQFCANWNGRRREVPKNFDALNKFCGVRMLFETETRTQLAELPEDHVTRYELVLAELIAQYGKPAGFTWRGRVTLEPIDSLSENIPRSDRKFSTWRWCPAPRDGLMTRCDASIVLTLDPDLGRGIVLFSTPELWQYAFAREGGTAQPDSLYTLLHALSLKTRTAYAQRRAASRKQAAEREEQAKLEKNSGAKPESTTETSERSKGSEPRTSGS